MGKKDSDLWLAAQMGRAAREGDEETLARLTDQVPKAGGFSCVARSGQPFISGTAYLWSVLE